MKLKLNHKRIFLEFQKDSALAWDYFMKNRVDFYIILLFSLISVAAYLYYSRTGLHLAYNDAMSHLNIARRVFDNLQPGLAQLGSVWLPLPHLLMMLTSWNTLWWHSGLTGGIVSMVSYVLTCYATYKTVNVMTDNRWAGFFASCIVGLNLNFLYMQTTALTETLFIALFSLSLYYLVKWLRFQNPLNLVLLGASTFFMTLTRYDAWFVFPFLALSVFVIAYRKKGYAAAEGLTILYATSGVLGIFLWFLYNYIIFSDPFYFALGEFSAKAQQTVMEKAGVLATKGDIFLSLKTYYYAVVDNIGFIVAIFALVGIFYYLRKNGGLIPKIIALALLSTTIFNILALFFGFSVIYVPEVTGNSWFNVRYGLIALPVASLFIGYLLSSKERIFVVLVPILIVFQVVLYFKNNYAVTITDGTMGASQKNVKPIGKAIRDIYNKDKGLILVSAASHDAILFASGINLDQFIHEGANKYWDSTLANPEVYAKYIIMRTNDDQDSVSRGLKHIKDFDAKFEQVYDGDFADIYKRRF